MAEALEIVAKKINTTGARCISAIPAGSVSFRNKQVPFHDKKKIRQVLPFELETALPYPIEDMIVDYIPCSAEGSSKGTNLIAACVGQARVAAHLDVLQQFGLRPESIRISGLSIVKSVLASSDAPDSFLVVDVDGDTCTLFAVAAGQVCYIRNLTLGKDRFDSFSQLGRDIQRTLLSIPSSSDAFTPDMVFLSGGTSGNDIIRQALKDALKVTVNPVSAPKKCPSGAWALAMTEPGEGNLNFRRGAFSENKLWAEYKKDVIRTAAMLLFAIGAIGVNMGLDIHFRQNRLEQLNKEIRTVFQSTFPGVKRIVDPLQQMRVKVAEAKKASQLAGVVSTPIHTIDVLYYISQQIPKSVDVNFDRLDISTGSAIITGHTATFNSVDNMKNRLERTPAFKKITIVSTSKDKTGKRVQFKLKIDV